MSLRVESLREFARDRGKIESLILQSDPLNLRSVEFDSGHADIGYAYLTTISPPFSEDIGKNFFLVWYWKTSFVEEWWTVTSEALPDGHVEFIQKEFLCFLDEIEPAPMENDYLRSLLRDEVDKLQFEKNDGVKQERDGFLTFGWKRTVLPAQHYIRILDVPLDNSWQLKDQWNSRVYLFQTSKSVGMFSWCLSA
ncbi:MAG: hypothetical protein AAFN80_02545 [Pseudomonadota bacterium]